jgi:hypothetical protein
MQQYYVAICTGPDRYMTLQQVAKFRTEHARPLLTDVSGQTTGGSTVILWFKGKPDRQARTDKPDRQARTDKPDRQARIDKPDRQAGQTSTDRQAGQTSTDSFLLFQGDSEVTPTGPIFVKTSYLEFCHSLWTYWLRLD